MLEYRQSVGYLEFQDLFFPEDGETKHDRDAQFISVGRAGGIVPLKPKAGLNGPPIVNLDLDPAAEGSGGIVGFGTVVIQENGVEAAITKEGATEFSDIGRRLYPTRSFRIELSELLQVSILFFR